MTVKKFSYNAAGVVLAGIISFMAYAPQQLSAATSMLYHGGCNCASDADGNCGGNASCKKLSMGQCHDNDATARNKQSCKNLSTENCGANSCTGTEKSCQS